MRLNGSEQVMKMLPSFTIMYKEKGDIGNTCSNSYPMQNRKNMAKKAKDQQWTNQVDRFVSKRTARLSMLQ